MTTRKHNQAGFTLIELLIITLIVGMVAAAMTYNFRAGDKQRRVNLMRDAVVSALRAAQGYTLAGRQIPPPGQAPYVRGGTRCVNDNAAISYWVEFASGPVLDIMAEDRCGAIMRIQRFNVVDRTNFPATNPFSITVGLVTTDSTSLAIRFLPPFATMTVSNEANPLPADFSAFNSASITVQYDDGSKSKGITVDGISGRIE